MEWTADVGAGEWIRERLDEPWAGTMHDVVPHGFDAYARIFHPVDRDRPVGRPWPPVPYGRHRKEWAAFQADDPEIESERVSWAEAATGFGTTMHADAQWHHIAEKYQEVQGEDGPRDAAGWRYGQPAQGQLAPDLFAAVAWTLSAHTSTPDDVLVAVWEGWGGLTGGLGFGPSRVLYSLSVTDDSPRDAVAAQHDEFLGRSAHNQLENAFRKPTWQPGILSDEISRGARLSLPNRDYVLFRAAMPELADPVWQERAPWRDESPRQFGQTASAESPSLMWPEDRAWVFVSEVDYDSTIVGGSSGLIRAICADRRIEALPIREGTELGWDADEANR
jgi:hypothetical protein